MTIQDGVFVFIGLLACFMGYSMFRSILPMWGFILGGWLAYLLLPTFLGGQMAASLIFRLAGVLVGGLIGALIATPLYFVIIFLSGAVLGMLFGVMAGALVNTGGLNSVRQFSDFASMSFPPMPQTGIQWLLMVVFGLLLGALALNFQKFMICASSAFLGAAALITGLGGSISMFSGGDASHGAWMLIGFLGMGLVGLVIQYRMMGEA